MARLDLGVGIVVFPDLLPILDDLGDLVDCLEVEPQTYWLPTADPGAPWRFDEDARDELVGRGRPILAHGVSGPVGSAHLPDARTLDHFAACVKTLGALGASEHLSFNQTIIDGQRIEAGVFLPPCPNDAGVALSIEAIREYQRRLDVPFSVETGVSYLQPYVGELPDSIFAARVANGADCGILLDLHNLWCNELNGRERVVDALDRMPLDRVTEVHLAGGLQRDTHYLDAHSGLTPSALLELTEVVLPRLANVRAVVFEIMPTFLWRVGVDPLVDHLAELQQLVARARRANVVGGLRRLSVSEAPSDGTLAVEPEEWERTLVAAATGWGSGQGEQSDDPTLGIMRHLVDSGRRGRVTAAARLTVRLLLVSAGAEVVDQLFDDYCASTPPSLWGHDEGMRFLDWIEALPHERIPRLSDAIKIDRALLQLACGANEQTLTLTGDPTEIARALEAGHEPPAGRRPTLATIA